jgi:hypothetical protein
MDTESDAIAAWNKRADGELAELGRKVGELREYLALEMDRNQCDDEHRRGQWDANDWAREEMKTLGLGGDE